MGLALLILGLAIFVGVHWFTTMRGHRAALIARVGEGPYKGLYSLVALIGFVLICYGFGQYRATGWIDIWDPPPWTRHVALPLVWLAFVCLAAAYLQGNIKKKLKHPMLVGIKLWAVADRISLKSRTDAGGLVMPQGGWKNDALAVVAGSIIFLAFGYVFHPLWIGVPVMGRTTLGT